MFCQNCGSNIADAASTCPHCGVQTPKPAPDPEISKHRYCQNCGSQVERKAYVCVHCGVRIASADPVARALAPDDGKSWVVSLVLCLLFFCSGLGGLHRFYTGRFGTGILQLVTAGGCGIWQIIDVILILTDSFDDADNQPLVRA